VGGGDLTRALHILRDLVVTTTTSRIFCRESGMKTSFYSEDGDEHKPLQGRWDEQKPLQGRWFENRAVMVLKPKPKTAILRRNQTTTELRFSGGHVTVFLEFQKWPSPVTNVPKQQPNYHLSRIPASTDWCDRLTARSGVARQPNYSPWQVDLCAAVGAIKTDAYIQVDSSHTDKLCEWRGESRLIDAHVSMRDRHDYYSLQLKKKKHVSHPMQINVENKLL